MWDRDEDLKAVAELVLEADPEATAIKVGWAIREHLGHRDAKTTIEDAQFALSLVGTPRALKLIDDYRVQHAANMAAWNRDN